VTVVLGIDGGGTKTHALLADPSGAVAGVGQDGPSNWETVGLEGAIRTLQAVLDQALADAGASVRGVAAATFGLGGIDWPSDVERLGPALAPLGLPVPAELVNDAFVALRAGTPRSWGVAVVAGTGTVAAGRDPSGGTFRTLGLGHEFGDYGDSADMSNAALAAVARAHTGMGQPTALTDALLRATGASGVEELLEGLSRDGLRLPQAGPLVVLAADRGDGVAVEIMSRVGRSLGLAAAAVARRLGLEALEFDVVLSGGLFRGGSHLLRDALWAELARTAPRSRLVELEVPPVVGAAVMALERLGVEVTPTVRARLAEGAARSLAPAARA
jgi:N-acetylglucosamine kinase-like BadF-type ATPase